MAKRKKVKWSDGDLFGVALPDGRRGLGQVLGTRPGFPNVLNCAFFDVVFDPATPPPALDKDRLISVVSTTRDLLDDGTWTVVGHAPGCIPRSQWPNEAFAKDGYVGAVTFGSGIVNKFLAAYHGMFPWNGFKDPNYFERLLVPAAKPPLPSRLLFNPTARPAREIFQSAARSLGDLAGVFEYEGETGYFYLYALEDAEGHEVLDAIHIVSGDADFAEGEVQVRWTREEDRVGLFIRETLWAVFDCQTRTKHGGDYRRGETPALPPHVTEPFE